MATPPVSPVQRPARKRAARKSASSANAPRYRNRTLSYKRCEFIGISGRAPSLARLITEACAKGKPMSRRRDVGSDGTLHVLNQWEPVGQGAMHFGELYEFTPGNVALYVRTHEDADRLPLEPVDRGDPASHLLEGVLFFAALDNHVVVSPTRSISVKQLQEHLNWLLKDHAGLLPADVEILLRDEVDAGIRQKWRGVRKVKFNGPLDLVRPEVVEDERRIATTESFTDKIIDFFLPFVAKDRKLSASEAERATRDLQRIRVTAEMSYDGKVDRLDTEALDHLAHMIRDDEAHLYEFVLVGQGKVTGTQLKLQDAYRLPFIDGHPQIGGMALKMERWLADLFEAGRVRQ